MKISATSSTSRTGIIHHRLLTAFNERLQASVARAARINWPLTSGRKSCRIKLPETIPMLARRHTRNIRVGRYTDKYSLLSSFSAARSTESPCYPQRRLKLIRFEMPSNTWWPVPDWRLPVQVRNGRECAEARGFV